MNYWFLVSVSADQTATANKDKEQQGGSSQKDLAVIAGGFSSSSLQNDSQLIFAHFLHLTSFFPLPHSELFRLSSSTWSLLPLAGLCRGDAAQFIFTRAKAPSVRPTASESLDRVERSYVTRPKRRQSKSRGGRGAVHTASALLAPVSEWRPVTQPEIF